MHAAGTPASRIDIGHVGVFRALAKAAGLDGEAEESILQLLQIKDVPGLRDFCTRFAEPYRSALMRLPELFGGDELANTAANRLPALPEIYAALATLKQLRMATPDLPLSFDLADLRGYHYPLGLFSPPIIRATRARLREAVGTMVLARILAGHARQPASPWICAKLRGSQEINSLLARFPRSGH